jgi:hypothetical protein
LTTSGSRAILEPRKLAAIVTLTEEMLASSNAEALVTDAVTRSVGLALDAALFDAVAGDDTRPALRRSQPPPTSIRTRIWPRWRRHFR